MKIMKSIRSLLFGAVAFCAALTSFSQTLAPTFALTSLDIGATNSHAIIPANGEKVAQVDYVNVTSDKAASKLLYYKTSDPIIVTLGTNASQAVIYAPGTGNLAANDIIVLRHVASETYERLVVSAVAATTVTATANPTAATVAGDLIYKVSTSATFTGAFVPVGNATVSVSGASFFGQQNKPTYVEVDGTAASQINIIAGRYVRLPN
jgi:hypothetical protein